MGWLGWSSFSSCSGAPFSAALLLLFLWFSPAHNIRHVVVIDHANAYALYLQVPLLGWGRRLRSIPNIWNQYRCLSLLAKLLTAATCFSRFFRVTTCNALGPNERSYVTCPSRPVSFRFFVMYLVSISYQVYNNFAYPWRIQLVIILSQSPNTGCCSPLLRPNILNCSYNTSVTDVREYLTDNMY